MDVDCAVVGYTVEQLLLFVLTKYQYVLLLNIIVWGIVR
jgi:hypothetical protein